MGLYLFSPVCFLWPSDTYNRFHKKKHNTLKSKILAKKSPLKAQVHSEGDQPWDFFGRNDAKAETPVLWPPHVKS